MSEFNNRLKQEANARGYLNWKDFKKADQDLADKVRIEIIKDEQEVSLW
jgi:hypothetical protein